MTPAQQIFTVFFAIFWGALASGQGRYKPFGFNASNEDDPDCNDDFCPDVRRILLSFGLLNLFPIIYFVFMVLWLGSPRWSAKILTCNSQTFLTAFFAVLLAFGVFGFYRFWISTIEFCSRTFYSERELEKRRKKQPADYHHGLALRNLFMALLYLPVIPTVVTILAKCFLKVAP